ncbi:MATE family efflux transporter [Solirubrobacter ginsenosidimutans]|uniref:MATE family efflux transporter n=1 Tax=Solirubrobacter ginsenosidimutans TaxID=490573 RepID=A0A9X3S5F1_9ACTN|nr:MATE family efflux transporter [Solirubrobacter ginsenosidimutans]MDA0165557.1 MATE family efflux transporter [Solirubrobacter ginsenosidimutans]
MRLRSSYDREILLLALPALGALAAEPLYVLVDTAIVGHLGTTQLASLAIAATVLSTAFTIFNFLTYGTTAQVSRLHGAGQDRSAAALGSQALWLGIGIGLLLLVIIELTAPAVVSLMGGEGEVKDGAVLYLRIAALGSPLFILASAAQGYLRGMGDLRTPLFILVAAHIVNAGLELLFVYGFDWGLKGSAWGTVIAQAGMAGAFFVVQYRAGLERPHPDKMRPLMRIGSEIAVRTTALTGSFLLGSAVLARIGAASLGAHQIAFQLWVFLALVLDAIAIAGQVMVGRMLGAGAATGAREAATRMIGWSVAIGALFGLVLLATGDLIPQLFTSDPAVIEKAGEIWPLFALMMPFNGAVFALDGILIGAGDTRFLMWGMLAAAAVYIPIALLALHNGWGITGVWWGLVALIAIRLVTCGARFAGSRWALTGAPA